MTANFKNKITAALAIATALFLTSAAFAGPNTNSKCYLIYDWFTQTWKLVCLPW